MAKIELKTLEVRPIGRRTLFIKWEFSPTLASFQDYTITLERSESPEEGYKKIAKISQSINSYLDEDVRIFRFWKDIYVRMHITSNDGKEGYYTEPAVLMHPPDTESLEFVRRLNITLGNRKYGVGVECYAFMRKHSGQTCGECYDSRKKRVIKSQCESCYTVGYEGGFYNPIKLSVAFSQDQKSVVLTDRGSESNSSHSGYTSNYPLLNPGDLIYDARLGRLWRVESMVPVERRRHIVKQNLSLTEVQKSSVFYTMCETRLKEELLND